MLSYQMPSTPFGLGEMLALVIFVIVFGTILVYGLFLAGLRRALGQRDWASFFLRTDGGSSAAFVFLGVILTAARYLAGALIILAAVLLASRRIEEDTQA